MCRSATIKVATLVGVFIQVSRAPRVPRRFEEDREYCVVGGYNRHFENLPIKLT